MLCPVVPVLRGDLRDQRVERVGVRQEGADGEEHLGNGEGGRPLVFQDVEADLSIAVDVHVVNFGRECDLRGLEGVVGRELDVQEEYALVVRGVLRAHDRCLPVELVRFVSGASRAVRGRVSSEVNELLLDSSDSHLDGDCFVIKFLFFNYKASNCYFYKSD